MNSRNMQQWLQASKPGLTLIATSGVPLDGLDGLAMTDFAPYVAAINLAGEVAFQAAWHRNGQAGTGIFCGSGGALTHLAEPDGQWQFVSHPAINDDGVVSVYAQGCDSQRVLLMWRGDGWHVMDTQVAALAINPVSGNEFGQLAIRVALKDGQQLILRSEAPV